MKTFLMSCVRRILDRLAELVLLPTVLALGVVPGSVVASTIALPIINIGVTDAETAGLNGAQWFTWIGRPLAFSFAVHRREDTAPVDVYFGVLTPGGRVFSWSPGAGAPNLQEGLFPVGQGITATEISSALLGSNPEYTFPPGHEIGIYSVFCFLLPAGVDPRSPRSWINASMSPVVVSN